VGEEFLYQELTIHSLRDVRTFFYESDGCVKYNAPGGGLLLLQGGWGKSSSTRN
jgi:hypothetical protein